MVTVAAILLRNAFIIRLPGSGPSTLASTECPEAGSRAAVMASQGRERSRLGQ